MVGHGPESPRFDRRYSCASTCACVVWNNNLPLVGRMLALRHDDGVAFDSAGPPEEEEDQSDDEEGEKNTSHDQP